MSRVDEGKPQVTTPSPSFRTPQAGCADQRLSHRMTELTDPGVHAAIEVVALDRSAPHAGAVRAAFPRACPVGGTFAWVVTAAVRPQTAWIRSASVVSGRVRTPLTLPGPC